MQVEYDIASGGGYIQWEWKGDVEDVMSEFVLIFACGFDDVRVIEEAGRPNQHVAIPLNAPGRLVPLKFKCFYFFLLLGLH